MQETPPVSGSGHHDPRDILTRPAPAGQIIHYGHDHPDQVMELYVPPAKPRGVVVFLHGGFWKAAYDRSHARPLCNSLAGEGYLVISVEYRRTGGGGGWYVTFSDVDLAMHTLPQVLRKFRAHKLPLVVSGHSAGGQLALWVTSEMTESRRLTRSQRQGLASPAPITGVLALAPVADLDYGFDEDLGDGAVRALMGGPSQEFPDRYAHVDPLRLTVEEPVVILHGTKDDRVPLEVSRRYTRVNQADLVELDDIGHFELIDPLHPVYTNVLESITGLMSNAR